MTILMMLLIFCGTLYAESPNLDDLFTPENIILLANHIQELEARNVYLEKENQRLDLENKHLETALAEERKLVIRLKENEDRLLSLMDEQIKDLKFVYENNRTTAFDKAYLFGGGAAIAAIVLLLATTM